MSKMFLDPNQPLHTCKEESCDHCSVADTLVCHFTGKRLGLFLLMFLPLFGLAGYALFTYHIWIFAAWLVFVFVFFGLIEIRVMCSHCPHYAELGLKTLKCWVNYGSPKLWKYRPGPMSPMETIVFFLGFILILIPPAVLAGLQQHFWLMGTYLVFLVLVFSLLHVFYCSHCINFVCPLNVVNKRIRQEFVEKNPNVKKKVTSN
ncbi:MAG: hypothetical protein KAT14_04870 [Candidatus Marinimicrobia bacterium]|nr:hypothetical protein [Candidatus Neomarinimicrobiota bacterium]